MLGLSVDAARLTVRSLPPSALAALLLAAVPATATVAFGGTNLTGSMVAVGLVAGALVGFAADDPAAGLLEASPTTLLVRRLHHLVALLVFVAALVVAMVVLVAVVHDGPPISLLARTREGLAAAGFAASASAWLARSNGERRPGSFGLLFGLLGPLLVSALAVRVRGLPMLNGVPDASRWWWVAAAGFAAAVWWSRDPARR